MSGSRARWPSLAVLLVLTLASWIPAAEMDFGDFGEALHEAIGGLASEQGTTFTLCHDGVLIFKAGPEKLPEVRGILEDYGVWLNPSTQIVLYAKPPWKNQVEAFIGEAAKRCLSCKRIPKPGSDDLVITFGLGGKQTDVVVAVCLKHTPVLQPNP